MEVARVLSAKFGLGFAGVDPAEINEEVDSALARTLLGLDRKAKLPQFAPRYHFLSDLVHQSTVD